MKCERKHSTLSQSRINNTGCHATQDIPIRNTKGPFLPYILILFYLRRCFQYSIVCNHIRAFFIFYNILHLFLLMSAVSVMVLNLLLTVSYCIPKDGC